MKLAEAKAECERWFANLHHQRERTTKMQKIASDRRNGLIDETEACRRVRQIDGLAPRVYDAARLEQAVRLLLKLVK